MSDPVQPLMTYHDLRIMPAFFPNYQPTPYPFQQDAPPALTRPLFPADASPPQGVNLFLADGLSSFR